MHTLQQSQILVIVMWHAVCQPACGLLCACPACFSALCCMRDVLGLVPSTELPYQILPGIDPLLLPGGAEN